MALTKRRLSIRTQLTLLVLAFMLAAISAFAWYLTTDFHNASKAAYAEARLLADNTAATFTTLLRNNEDVLDRLANRPLIKKLDSNNCDPLINDYVYLHPEFNPLAIRDINGNSICVNRPHPLPAAAIVNYPWFRDGISSGKFLASDIFQGYYTGRWLSMLTYPIHDNNQIAGLLILPIDLLKLNALLFPHPPKTLNTVITVLDRNNKIVLRSIDPEKWISQSIPAHRSETLKEKQGYYSLVGIDGVSRLVAFVTLPNGWKVLAGVPEATVFAAYREHLRQSIVIGLSLLLALLIFAWRITSTILRPVRDLAQTSKNIAEGNLTARLNVSGPIETEIVAQQFNHMLDVLQEHEAALQTSEARYRQIVESAQEGIWTIDAQALTRFVNAKMANMLGYPVDEMLGRPITDFMSAQEIASAEKKLERRLSGVEEQHDFAFLNKSGEIVDTSLTTSPLYDAEGAYAGTLAMVTNISDRKVAEEKLRLTSELLDASQSISKVGGWEIDLVKNTLFWTAETYRIHDTSPNEYTPTVDSAIQFYAPQSILTMRAAIQASIERGIAFDLELELITAKKRPIWVHTTSFITAQNGRTVKITGAFQDITERRLTEIALRKSEERFRLLWETTTDVVVIHDQDSIIQYVNPALLNVFGYNPNELIGKNISVLQPEKLREAHRLGLARYIASGMKKLDWWASEAIGLHQDGHEFPVEISFCHMHGEGQHIFGGFIRDITDRKKAGAVREQLEMQLRESQKMEAIGTLAGGIAHDFNNILGAILGNVALARAQLSLATPNGNGNKNGNTDEKESESGTGTSAGLESLDEIQKAGNRAKHLVRQILSFSRKETHELITQSLQPIIEESLGLLRATLPTSVNLEFRRDTSAQRPLFVSTDATQISQVLLNLCTNAWHALQGGGGRIEVALSEHHLDKIAAQRLGDLAQGRYACISIADTGHGMSEATLARIFEPFYTTKPVGVGTGLGLAVVHGIVKTLHGAITAESQPNEGTTFKVFIPLVEAPPQPTLVNSATTPLIIDGQGKHVLYVDDDEAMVFLVKRMLSASGYRVSGFIRAAAALDAVRAQEAGSADDFDLVVTDFNMPGFSGLDVAQELASLRPELPVVITSGYITDELRLGARAVGVRYVLYKPNTVDELCETIQRLLRVSPPTL